MKERLPLVVILGGSLTFLASLYLTWDGAVTNPAASRGTGSGLGSLFDLLSQNGYGRDASWGWASSFGAAGALCAMALCAGAAATLVRPQLLERLPFARCALALLLLAVMTLADLRLRGLLSGAFDHVHTKLEAGAYLGVTAAAVTCLSCAALRGDKLPRPSPEGVVAAVFTGGLVAAFLVPDLTFHPPHVSVDAATGYEFVNAGSYGEIFSAAVALLALPLWRRGASSTGRIAIGGSLVLLAAGSLGPLGLHRHWPWQAWVWMGCAGALFILAIGMASPERNSRPSPSEASIAVAACAVLASLFLPWQGGPLPSAGWAVTSEAGVLATVLMGAVLGWRRVIPEVGLAVAFYVLVAGFDATQFGTLAYGAIIGFSATVALLLAIGVHLRPGLAHATRLLLRIVPIGACFALLGVPVLGFATPRFDVDYPWRLSWLLLAAVVVTFRLLGRWLAARGSDELVLLPLTLIALLGLDLIFIRGEGIHAQGWLSLGLCLLLLAMGWIGERTGLDRFRIPEEIWRVDRISTAED